MTDQASANIAANVALNMENPAPALSATSDTPEVTATPAAVEAPKVETPAVQTEVTEKTEVKVEPEAKEPPKVEEKDETPAWMKARISKADNKARAADEARVAAEQKADAAAKRVDEALAAIKALTPKEPDPAAIPRPDRTKFDSPDEYDAALVKWTEDRTAAAVRAEETKKHEETTAAEKFAAEQKAREAEQATMLNAWAERVTKTVKELPDFEDVVFKEVKDGGPNITEPMRDAIVTVDNGPKIAYHLGKNPEEALRISGLHPVAQFIEIGKLSEQLSRPVVSVSKAPDPITPTGARQNATERSDNELSGDEYYEKYAEKRRAAARSH